MAGGRSRPSAAFEFGLELLLDGSR